LKNIEVEEDVEVEDAEEHVEEAGEHIEVEEDVEAGKGDVDGIHRDAEEEEEEEEENSEQCEI
jgi:hypothetical protein